MAGYEAETVQSQPSHALRLVREAAKQIMVKPCIKELIQTQHYKHTLSQVRLVEKIKVPGIRGGELQIEGDKGEDRTSKNNLAIHQPTHLSTHIGIRPSHVSIVTLRTLI